MKTEQEIREMLKTVITQRDNTEDILLKSHLASEARLLRWILESEE